MLEQDVDQRRLAAQLRSKQQVRLRAGQLGVHIAPRHEPQGGEVEPRQQRLGQDCSQLAGRVLDVRERLAKQGVVRIGRIGGHLTTCAMTPIRLTWRPVA